MTKRTSRITEIQALRLCAPIIADILQALEECHSLPGDKTGRSIDGAAREEWKRYLKAHAALVEIGLLPKGRFRHRPASSGRRK